MTQQLDAPAPMRSGTSSCTGTPLTNRRLRVDLASMDWSNTGNGSRLSQPDMRDAGS